MNKQKQTGFTLVELMVTIAILGILAAIAYPSYIDYIRKGRLEDARATIVDNIKMMERYYGAARTFGCRADYAKNIGETCNGQVLNPNLRESKVAEKYYDFSITMTDNNNNYIITATPKKDVYNDNTLANNQLILIYHSGRANYAKCTSTGKNTFMDTKATSNEGCSSL